jgi:hypothetical protein
VVIFLTRCLLWVAERCFINCNLSKFVSTERLNPSGRFPRGFAFSWKQV